MHYNTTPNTPRPMASVIAGAASDARWRDLPRKCHSIDRLRALDVTRAKRQAATRRRGKN